MSQENEIVKIRTKIGRIITLTVYKKSHTHYEGTDKFGKSVIIPIDEIDSMLPVVVPGGWKQ